MQMMPEQQRRLAEAWEGRIPVDQLSDQERRILADKWEEQRGRNQPKQPETDIFGDTGFDRPAQPKPVSRIPGAATLRDNLQDIASENTGIPVVGPAIRGAAMLGAGVADMGARPVDATLEGMEQVITSPRRTIEGVGRASEAAMQGKPVQAVNEALGAGTAAMEFGLAAGAPFAAPVVSRAAQVAKPAATGAEAAFARTGVDPSIAALSDSQAVKGMTKTISENFIGGRGVRNNTEKQLKQLEGATQKQIDALGATSPYDAGEIAAEGVKLFDKNAGKLYEKALTPERLSKMGRLDATTAQLVKEGQRFQNPDFQALFEPKSLERVRDTFTKAEVSVEDIRNARTEIRRIQKSSDLKKTEDDYLLERLESALTEDLYRIVGEQSGPRALSEMKRADTYYRGVKERMSGALKPFVRNSEKPEQAFRNIMSAMQQTGSRSGTGNFQQIRKLKNALSADQAKDVAGGVLKAATRKEEGGEFNLNAFVTNWNRMGPEQKNIMFGHPGSQTRDNLEDLFTVAEKLKSVEDMANFSRSGVTAQNFGTIYGFGAAPITTSAVLLGEAVAGRVLTNPRYVKVVRDQMNAEYQAARLRQLGNEAMANAMLERQKTRTLTALSAIQGTDPSIPTLIEAINDNMPQQEQPVRTQPQP